MKRRNSRIIAITMALLMVVMLIPMSASAVSTYNGINIQFGDPAYPATWPESNMELSGSGDTYSAVYNGTDTNYYPNILSMYAVNNFTEIRGTGVHMVTHDSQGNPTVHTTINSTINGSDVYTLAIGATGGSIAFYNNANLRLTISFSAPNSPSAGAGATPNIVNGYLPVGQFARTNSLGWGQLMNDDTNVPNSGNATKFINGLASTGVSLGMLGGYVQFKFDDAISNNPDNKYGIDFIVYGNAFVGNPEAGSVMVYGKNEATQSYGWYNLAGSRYYISGSTPSTDISYLKITNATTIGNKTFGIAGIYTSTDFVPPASDTASLVNAAISEANWSSAPVTTVTSWWPEYGSPENYGNVWKLNYDKMDNIHWNREGTAEVITYQGLAQVQDDFEIVGNSAPYADMTDCYQWGYADVRANGNLGYGVAINPYASTASAVAGGDGFDLSWAVDSEGKPVNISDVHYVRVYSGVLYNAGIFGETSTEVCGIYTASQTGSGTASTYLYVEDSSGGEIQTTDKGVSTTSPGVHVIASDAEYVYINGEKITDAETGHAYDIQPGQAIQIITQNGTESPYVTVIICN